MIPPSPLTSSGATGLTPALIPTLSVDTSTNNVSVSTARSLTRVVVPETCALPDTLKLEPAPVMVRVPVIVSPVFNTFADAAPDNDAVIVLAEKLPDASRKTPEFPTFPVLNIILPSFHIFCPLIVRPSALATDTASVPEFVVALPPDAVIDAVL